VDVSRDSAELRLARRLVEQRKGMSLAKAQRGRWDLQMWV